MLLLFASLCFGPVAPTIGVRAALDRGAEALREQRWDEAIGCFGEAVRLHPSCGEGFHNRGLAWAPKGNLDRAVADFSEAIRLEPEDAAAFHNRAFNWEQLGEPEKALKDLDEATRLAPRYANNSIGRGRILSWQGKYEEAVKEFDRAVSLRPDAAAFVGRGIARAQLKDLEGATADFGEAVRLEPRNPSAYFTRSSIWLAKREWNKALADYTTLTELRPGDPVGFRKRCRLLATCPDPKLRDGRKAVSDGKRACELTLWKGPRELAALAAAYAEAGDFNEAVKWQKQALADAAYVAREGEVGREALKLYEQKKPHREPAWSVTAEKP